PPTTSPLSSTTARWNIGTARQPVPSPSSRRPSTASMICARSSAVATAATSNTSSSLDDFSAGIRALHRLTQPRPRNGRNIRGLPLRTRADQTRLPALPRPGSNLAGLRRADLLPLLGQSSAATLTRQLVRLRHLGVIKRVTGTYRYYLTRAAIAAGRRLT